MNELDTKDFIEIEQTAEKMYNLEELDFASLYESECNYQFPDSTGFKGLYLLPVNNLESTLSITNSIRNAIVTFRVLGLNVNNLLRKFGIMDKEQITKLVNSDIVRLLVLFNTNYLTECIYTLNSTYWTHVLKKFATYVGFD
jgi:hypothetical protein